MWTFSDEEMEGISRPTEEVRGLPGTAYTSSEFFTLEEQNLFGTHWVCVGLEDEVPNPGDVQPVTAAGKSLFMMRDQTGKVNVFHNFCRHRGHRLVTGTCSVKGKLMCPYHSWDYGVRRRLFLSCV